MNRNTAIFLALGILLVHGLSIYRDYQWHFAQPFDGVHVAFELAENLGEGHGATLGESADPPAPGLQAYPAPLWVGLLWLASKLGWSLPEAAQMLSLLCALLLIPISTRIAFDRVAGVIPPLLLVLSGTMACGAACGTEHMALAFFATAAYVAFERDHPRWLALFLCLLVATRAEGLLLAGAWFLFWAVDRIKRKGKRNYPLWVFAPALAVGLFFCWYKPAGEDRGLYIEGIRSALAFPESWQGLLYVRDFAVVAASPILLLFTIGFLLAGKLSGAGIRALVLVSVWVAWTVRIGGDTLPFGLALLPIFPLACLAIQETIVAALDTYRPSMEAASWIVLFMAAFASASASKFPGDVGPLSLRQPHSQWLQSKATVPLGLDHILGRTQLHTEIQQSLQMRLIADFLQEHTQKGERILTPRAGQLSYHTDLTVEDWFGRLQTKGELEIRPPFASVLNAPLDQTLGTLPDYVLPGIAFGAELDPAQMRYGISRQLLHMAPKENGIRRRVIETIRDEYTLVSMPIPNPAVGYREPIFLFQRKHQVPDIELNWGTENNWNVLSVNWSQGRAIPQMVDLVVLGQDNNGVDWILTPAGRWVSPGTSRTTLKGMVLPVGESQTDRLTQFQRNSQSPQLNLIRVSAQLFRSGVSRQHDLARLGPPAEIVW